VTEVDVSALVEVVMTALDGTRFATYREIAYLARELRGEFWQHAERAFFFARLIERDLLPMFPELPQNALTAQRIEEGLVYWAIKHPRKDSIR